MYVFHTTPGYMLQKSHLPKVLKFSSSWHGGTAFFAALLANSAIDQVDPVQIRARDTVQSSSFPPKFVSQNTKSTCWRSQPHAQPTNRWNLHPLATSPPLDLLPNRWYFLQLFLHCQDISFFANISRRYRKWPVLGWSRSWGWPGPACARSTSSCPAGTSS